MHCWSPLSLGIIPFYVFTEGYIDALLESTLFGSYTILWKNSRGWQDKDTEETVSV